MTGSRRALPVKTVLPSTSAASKFRGFKHDPEGPQPIREPQTTKPDELKRLKELRAMLKSMPPEAVLTNLEICADLTFLHAVAYARQVGKLIVPHLVIDRIMAETEYKIESVRTGTLVAYEASNKPFGDTVAYAHTTFQIPERFRGRTNCALVVEHPDFEVVRNNHSYELRILDDSAFCLLEFFPASRWAVDHFNCDADFRIPFAGPVRKPNKSTRLLHRAEDSSYLGLLARNVYGTDRPSDIFVSTPWSDRIGVALFG